jgi:hypothetical protein
MGKYHLQAAKVMKSRFRSELANSFVVTASLSLHQRKLLNRAKVSVGLFVAKAEAGTPDTTGLIGWLTSVSCGVELD